jgi:hypothetical protein
MLLKRRYQVLRGAKLQLFVYESPMCRLCTRSTPATSGAMLVFVNRGCSMGHPGEVLADEVYALASRR